MVWKLFSWCRNIIINRVCNILGIISTWEQENKLKELVTYRSLVRIIESYRGFFHSSMFCLRIWMWESHKTPSLPPLPSPLKIVIQKPILFIKSLQRSCWPSCIKFCTEMKILNLNVFWNEFQNILREFFSKKKIEKALSKFFSTSVYIFWNVCRSEF